MATRPGKRRLSSASTRDHVHAVDVQKALAAEQPRCVDVGSPHVDGAHHDAGQVSPDKPGATQVHVGELRSLQVVRAGEGCHDYSFPSATPPLAHLSRFRQARDGIVLNAGHGCRPWRGNASAGALPTSATGPGDSSKSSRPCLYQAAEPKPPIRKKLVPPLPTRLW